MNDSNSANGFNPLQTIREQFPEHLRPKVIFKSTYDEIMQIKQQALEHTLNRLHLTPELNPCRHPLVFFASQKGSRLNKLDEPPLVKINEFLGKDDKRINAIMKEIEALSFPTNQQDEIDVQHYQTLVSEHVAERIRMITDAHSARLAKQNAFKVQAEQMKSQGMDEHAHKKPRWV